MLTEILRLPDIPIVHVFTDSKSLIENIVSTKIPSDRRLRVDVARLREMCSKGEIELHYVYGKNQITDSLTKHSASYYKLVDVLSKVMSYLFNIGIGLLADQVNAFKSYNYIVIYLLKRGFEY